MLWPAGSSPCMGLVSTAGLHDVVVHCSAMNMVYQVSSILFSQSCVSPTCSLGVLQRHVRVSRMATLAKNRSLSASPPPNSARWRSSGSATAAWPERGAGWSPSTSEVCSVHFPAVKLQRVHLNRQHESH